MTSSSPSSTAPERPAPHAECIEILRADYARFPKQQTYDIYAADVLFVDPLNRFRGVERYRQMIGWIDRWFRDVRLDLHEIQLDTAEPDDTARSNNTAAARIITRWTLHWRAPLPWQPAMAIAGWSELEVNDAGQISSHADYWHTSKWDVVAQLFKRETNGAM